MAFSYFKDYFKEFIQKLHKAFCQSSLTATPRFQLNKNSVWFSQKKPIILCFW